MPRRGSVAVAAAFLLGRRGDFADLAARKVDHREHFGLPRFRAPVADLAQRWPSDPPTP